MEPRSLLSEMSFDLVETKIDSIKPREYVI